MHIASVEIRNFRCLRHVNIDFGSVTTFIGPNGAGKSSVLRALNWFFNGERGDLSLEDVFAGARDDDQDIQVSVTFDRLTDADRSALGPRYAPKGVDTFTAWRTWSDGSDKITGKALAFPPFEEVRAADSAKAKQAALAAVLEAHPDLDLPSPAKKVDDSLLAMDAWERAHPDLLEPARVSDTHFFGFHGQGKLSGLFDFVLVTADLRASEESLDSRNTILGRILEKAVDRQAANEAFQRLADEVTVKQTEIQQTHLHEQLTDLALSLSDEVGSFTTGRSVQLRTTLPDMKAQPARVAVSILDEIVETSVERQGHGFQRALLIASLRLLASRGAKDSDGSVICLAIEEPELFQHPTQAKVFATVLRGLADDPEGGMQVAYATHSPYFVEPRNFDQIRRVTRTKPNSDGYADVRVLHASMDGVCNRLNSFVADDKIRARFDQVCLRNLSEALFADAVVVTEGSTDKGVLEGLAARTRRFEVDGISVADGGGKGHLLIPHAILSTLGIPTLIVFDNDAEHRSRAASDGKDEAKIAAVEQANIGQNRAILRYLKVPEQDYPEGLISGIACVFPDTLETEINKHWPEWANQRVELIGQGRAVGGKNEPSYALTSQICPTEPQGLLPQLIDAARDLVRPTTG